MSSDHDALAIQTVRALAMDAVEAAQSGHPGTPMALAPLGWFLFRHARRHDPSRPDWFDRDRFVLSCGHASMLQYALLHLSGYALPIDELRAFRQWGSKTPGHPEVGHTPGVEVTTGPLGQGLGVAVGMALAERQLAEALNRPGHTVVDHRTWVIASDGDLMEGISHEAAALAGHLQLGKLIVFWDDNRITIDGSTDLSMSEDVVARFRAYRWHTTRIEDVNDLSLLRAAIDEAAFDDRPSLVAVRSVIGFPAPNKQGTSAAHGAPLGAEEVRRAKEAMGWNHPPFFVPPELDDERRACMVRGSALSRQWNEAVRGHAAAFPELGRELARRAANALPERWDDDLPAFAASDKGLATRQASGEVLQVLSLRLPELVGGSADLAGSNNSFQKGLPAFMAPVPGEVREKPSRNIHFGVREQGMGAAVNGMALHGGVIPYGATFLVFSDYLRPALRLGALMGCPARYLFTHDSIGLGEDGPTHQPVEHLAMLRALPGFTTFRPADANEVRESWCAMLRCSGPAALILTRQAVPTLDRNVYGSAAGVHRGAYVLSDVEAPDVLLIASGSEVHTALQGQALLQRDGIRARVVSVPSRERFAEQDAAYQEAVLPRAVEARVVIEAGLRLGWEPYAGPRGGYVTLEHFGASAPAETLFERFGITATDVAQRAKRALEGST